MKAISALVVVIVILSSAATITGIFSDDGPGTYTFESIRKRPIVIYGKGLYRDMSAEVAPQGIAQDYVTLFLAIPLLVVSVIMSGKGSARALFLLSGTLGYFMVTYVFYMVMAMYNAFFLIYVMLAGASFYAFILCLGNFNYSAMANYFKVSFPAKRTGYFLMFTSVAIALLWLGVVVPPLLDGSIIPVQAEHYTTLIVQGFDLSILLPASFVIGFLYVRKQAGGLLLGPIYIIFLSLLMTALTAKVVAMALLGYNVIPVIFIIPLFNIISIFLAFANVRSITQPPAVSN